MSCSAYWKGRRPGVVAGQTTNLAMDRQSGVATPAYVGQTYTDLTTPGSWTSTGLTSAKLVADSLKFMKKTLSILGLFLFTFCAMGAGLTVSSLNGVATNLTQYGTASNLAVAQPSAGTTNVIGIDSTGHEVGIPAASFGGGGSTTNIIDPSNITINTLFTNTSGSNLVVIAALSVTTASSGAEIVGLKIDQNNDGTFETFIPYASGVASQISSNFLVGAVSPNGVYEITASGSGNASIISGSCQRIYSSAGSGGGSGTTPAQVANIVSQVNAASGVVTNLAPIILYRGLTTNLFYTDLPTVESQMTNGDRVEVPAGSFANIETFLMPRGAMIRGVGTSTIINFKTNAFVPSDNDSFINFTATSSILDSADATNNNFQVLSCFYLTNSSATNITIQGVAVSNKGGSALSDSATATGIYGLNLSGCNFSVAERAIQLSHSFSFNSVNHFDNSKFTGTMNTNLSIFAKLCTIGASAGSNYWTGCTITGDAQNQELNFANEYIACFIGGGVSIFQNTYVVPLNGCNRPFLIEGSPLVFRDGCIPDYLDAYNGLSIFINQIGNDATKLGGNELLFNLGSQISATVSPSYSILTAYPGIMISANFDSPAGANSANYNNSTNVFYTRYFGCPSASFNFSSIPYGFTNSLNMTNGNFALNFWALGGLWITNIGGINCLSGFKRH